MSTLENIENNIPYNPVIFSSTGNEWSEPRKCKGGCGHNVTFNDTIVGRDGDLIPHLKPHQQHFCPILYRNFHSLPLTVKMENMAK